MLDTKWKRPHGRPTEADLRQLFTYAQHFGAPRARLLYPQSGAGTAVGGESTPPLFNAKAGLVAPINCGISYLRVGQAAAEVPAADVDAVASGTGYLWRSIAAELLAWLPLSATAF